MQQETLDALDTLELDKLLWEGLVRDDTDEELVRQISKVLRGRDKNSSTEMPPEVRALFDHFVRQGL